MKTDRELLGLAAKAIGRKVKRVACDANSFGGFFFEDHDSDAYAWNPLEDDGDALRLAVKLHMQVRIDYVMSHVTADTTREDLFGCALEDEGDDGCKAARRAIVRAAAAIGKDMP